MFVRSAPVSEKAFALTPWHALSVGTYAGVLARTGQPERGRELIQKLGSGDKYGTSLGWAIFHTCCAEMDLAAGSYERPLRRDPLATDFVQSAIAEPVRAGARWSKLAAMMNLPAESS
jgi:hypothetical protein